MKCPHCGKFVNTSFLRTTPQNRYYFGCVVKIISDEIGYTPEETHQILKSLFLQRTVFVKTKDGVNELRIEKSTTELTTIEMQEYFEHIAQWAAEKLGIYIPAPETK